MKNAILPSVSSQLHSFGSMSQSIYEVPAQIDGTLNFYGNSFNYMDSNLYNNQYDFAIPPQFPMDYQSGLSTIMTMKRLDCPYDDGAVGYPTCTSTTTTTTTTYDDMDNSLQPLPFTKKLSVPLRLEVTDEAIKNPRKRPIEATKEDSKIRVSNNKIVLYQTNKKMAHQEQQPSQDKKKQEAFDHIPRQKAPVRRSQKLSDKITALQKLVSPYGKTDTASVLEEASISINLLQHQIQNLFNLKLSSSSINTEPLQYQKPHDLRNRGLCLVPVSFTQRLTEPERFTQRPTSRNHAMPRNF